MLKELKLIFRELQLLLVINKITVLFVITISTMLFLSCGKEKDPNINLEDGKSVVIRDLPGDTEASMASGVEGKKKRPFHVFLFRFKDQKQIWLKTKEDSSKWLKSKDWDLAFTGPYNSEVYLNNPKDEYNPGYKGEATGNSIVLIKQGYDYVNQAPSDQEFDNSKVSKVGWAPNEFDNGWFFYSLSTHIMKAIPNRTYAIRLGGNKYMKLQLINAYKGNPTAVTNMKWPAPYYTFRYFIQEDGSKNLQTK